MILLTGNGDDCYLGGAEETHVEDGPDTASDIYFAVAFKIKQARRHARAETQVFIRKRYAQLTAVCVAAEH